MNIDTSFVPLELDGASWSALEPLYASLRDRTVDDAADLERLLRIDCGTGCPGRPAIACMPP